MRQTDNTIFHRRAEETYSGLKNMHLPHPSPLILMVTKSFGHCKGLLFKKKEC